MIIYVLKEILAQINRNHRKKKELCLLHYPTSMLELNSIQRNRSNVSFATFQGVLLTHSFVNCIHPTHVKVSDWHFEENDFYSMDSYKQEKLNKNFYDLLSLLINLQVNLEIVSKFYF